MLNTENKIVILENEKQALAKENTVQQEKIKVALTQEKSLSEKLQDTENKIVILENEKQALAQENKVQQEKIKIALTQERSLSEKLQDIENKIVTLEKDKQTKTDEIKQLVSAASASRVVLESLQTDRGSLDNKFNALVSDLESSKKSLEKERNTSKKLAQQLLALQNTLKEQQQAESQKGTLEKTLAQKLDEKAKELATLTTSVEESQQLLKKREEQIALLKKSQEDGYSQLRSLQGEYDTLDSKYQKLLQPARSSKGKYIASVTYKKRGGKKVIRLKTNPNGSYKTVTAKQLASGLEALKKKHKENLYIKVVIPENSGLSYNEAWKFTSNLQRKYDYYFQK